MELARELRCWTKNSKTQRSKQHHDITTSRRKIHRKKDKSVYDISVVMVVAVVSQPGHLLTIQTRPPSFC
jgi:hypothetical protein